MKVSHTAIDSTLSVVATPPTASHRRTLEKLFRHPAAQNLDWDDALALFEVIGDVEHKNNDKWLFQIGAEHQPLAGAAIGGAMQGEGCAGIVMPDL